MDVCVIGCGPSGVSASIYLKMAGYDVEVFEGNIIGGQMNTTPEVRNLAGAGSISGWELSKKMSQQLKEHDIRVMAEEVIDVDLKNTPKKIVTPKGVYEADAVVIANGVIRRELGCENEERFKGKGVSYCAVCDGFLYKGKVVAVIGGGNSALEDTLYLSSICKKVYLIHRREEFRGDRVMLDRIRSTSNVEIITPATVEKITGDERVEAISINVNGINQYKKTDGVFVAVGLKPCNEMFSRYISLDERGYILADEMCRTDCNGVYAVGDTRRKHLRQIVTAMSDGAVASDDIIRNLSKKHQTNLD
ncbi:MAG: thioredoxin-disulfide reductase [Ruminococcaceae bacterium]|nr:thioredoxin-disulfide reductase [Oscillospiraceae bacterium]